MIRVISLLAGWLMDLLLGDPAWLPHPVVGFGKLIAAGEKRWNKGEKRRLKGALLAVALVLGAFLFTWSLLCLVRILALALRLGSWPEIVISAIIVFFCLAGTTLIREVREVFLAVDRSL